MRRPAAPVLGNTARKLPRRDPGRTRVRQRQAAAVLCESLKESNCRVVRTISYSPELVDIAAQSTAQRLSRLVRVRRGEDSRKLR
jgi:hypothetical protein